VCEKMELCMVWRRWYVIVINNHSNNNHHHYHIRAQMCAWISSRTKKWSLSFKVELVSHIILSCITHYTHFHHQRKYKQCALKGWEVILIACGGVLLLILIVTCCCCCYCKRRLVQHISISCASFYISYVNTHFSFCRKRRRMKDTSR